MEDMQQTLQKIIDFRRQIHMYPQTAFNEYQTRERVKRMLKQFGIQQSQWTDIAKTGLYVDIPGLAPQKGEKRCIAYRADMDALRMTQNNFDLQYRSKNPGAAHMCGHDGHTACLVGFVPLYLKTLAKIPKNKIVRLLFQPSEEGPNSGAQLMVKQGCLEGVDQVYGFHGSPVPPFGSVYIMEGPILTQMTIVRLQVFGTGGHGSEPLLQKIAIVQGMNLYMRINTYLNELMQLKKGLFSGSIPVFRSGQVYNAISDKAYMEGTLRSLQKGLREVIIKKIKQFIAITQQKGFKVTFKYDETLPLTFNHKRQTQHVIRVAQKLFGKQKVSKGPLPAYGSQDFAFFTQARPGAMFFISGARGNFHRALHNPDFDFNDSLVQKVVEMWYHLALDRLLYQNE